MEKESEKSLIESIDLIRRTYDAAHERKDDPDIVRNIVHNNMIFLASKFIRIAFHENKPEIIDLINSKFSGNGRLITDLELGITREVIWDEDENEYKGTKLFLEGKEIDSEIYRKLVREHEDKKRKEGKSLTKVYNQNLL